MRKQHFIALFLFLFAVTAQPLSVSAQQVSNLVSPDRQAELRAELEVVNKEIAEQQEILKAKQKESVSIERDIAILNAQISEAKLSIRAKNILLESLGKDIGVKNKTIKTLSERIDRSKESLSDLLRKTNEIDSYSLAEVLLTSQDFSEFFSDLDSYDVIKRSLRDSYLQITEAKENTEVEKLSLEQKKRKESDARAEIEAKKRKIELAEKEKKSLLALNKQQQKEYQGILAARQKRAADIRSALFGLRDSAAIPFGTALEYANLAFQKTGVRPAFLLAILTQETNLGQNIGTCNRPQDPPEKGWRVIMKPERDHTPYQELTSELGLNPDVMPLSCPWHGGWGGAMGPAQFIPSTWNLLKLRAAASIGKAFANPWEPKDAFIASALYLQDLGAGESGYSAQRDAACRYYSGRRCDNRKPANTFYGNQVMAKIQNIQENMIDPLNNI